MDITHRTALHLAVTPGPVDTFPECLRAEVEETARAIYEHRVSTGEAGDDLEDWLEAEREVLEGCLESPARVLPGGDLFSLVS